MSPFRLPVSQIDVELRLPTGADDLLVGERRDRGLPLAVELLERLAQRTGGGRLSWPSICVSDVDVALLHLRQALIGDRVRSDLCCPVPACRTPMDISFLISNYLLHHRPKPARNVRQSDDGEGYTLVGEAGVWFRLPTVEDQWAAANASDPVVELRRRCIRPGDVLARVRRRIEVAMAALAPDFYDELHNRCPGCDAVVVVPFDPLQYVLAEVAARAAHCLAEVDVLAARYHWSEAEILGLESTRRARYVELASERVGRA